MRGIVKWFSQEKGFGFITTNGSDEYFFSVHQIIGSILPINGTQVEFTEARSEKGLRAERIRIISMPTRKDPHQDDRVKCKTCDRKMVPRTEHYRGNLIRTYCPFCLATYINLQKPINPLFWIVIVIVIVALMALGQR